MRVTLLSTPMRYFVAVAEAGAVSRAAGQLHVAGSAVSRQIAALEASLGVLLFERRQRGMRLTEAGERLVAHLHSAVEEGEQALEQVRGLHAAGRRQVRIACTEGFVAGFLPAVMTRFREAHPEAVLHLAVTSTDEAVAQVVRKEVDLALAYRVATPRGCAVHHDGAAPLVALMRRGHALARRRSVTVAEVAACPLLLNERGATSRLLFDMACSVRGLVCEPIAVSSSLGLLLPMVREREVLMAGYLTAAHLVEQGDLVAVPFARGELPSRRLQLLSLKGRTLPPLAQACAKAIGDAIRAARSLSGRSGS
jgi:DNA-binding transcriptional LysR family regulator